MNFFVFDFQRMNYDGLFFMKEIFSFSFTFLKFEK